MKHMHRIEPPAEATRRYSHLDDVRKLPFKGFGAWATFVACHRFTGSGGQALRFRLRSSSQTCPALLIQFDASSAVDPSKSSSEWVPSSVAQTDHTGT